MCFRTLTAIVAVLLAAAIGRAAEPEINPAQRLLESSGESAVVRVGDTLSAFAFRDVQGREYHIGQSQPTVFVFLSTSCPLAKRYTQRLNRMQAECTQHDVALVGVFSNQEDARADVIAHAKQMQFTFPVVKDVSSYLAGRVGAAMTPQAVLVDGEGTIRYRGGIDDNRYENRVKQHYLQDALTALREDRTIEPAETKTLGCTIHAEDPADIEQVTYTQHVARILQDNCQSCHRPDQVAPFALTNYQEAKTWATEINAYSQSRLMPPWKAAAGFGEFQHVRRLNDSQLDLIARWVEYGAPQGPAEDLPPSPKFSDAWALGEPDFIVEMPEEYVIGPEGEDDYRHFIVPTNFDRDMYVQATDVLPGNRQTVHHVIVYVDTSGRARELDAADPGPGYTRFGGVGFEAVSSLGGWAPGSMPAKTPAGTGFWLPKGADVVLQVHYYRTGVEERDRTKVGLYFADGPNPVRLHTGLAINQEFQIPPGDQRHRVDASWEIKEPIYAVNVAPHMHLLGTEMKVTATYPDGKVEPLIWIKQWDFNWQGSYYFRQPILLPAGTRIDVESYFDNTADNPNQPNDPPRPVGWGEKTTDEMCIAFVSFLRAAEWQPDEDQVAARESATE